MSSNDFSDLGGKLNTPPPKGGNNDFSDLGGKLMLPPSSSGKTNLPPQNYYQSQPNIIQGIGNVLNAAKSGIQSGFTGLQAIPGQVVKGVQDYDRVKDQPNSVLKSIAAFGGGEAKSIRDAAQGLIDIPGAVQSAYMGTPYKPGYQLPQIKNSQGMTPDQAYPGYQAMQTLGSLVPYAVPGALGAKAGMEGANILGTVAKNAALGGVVTPGSLQDKVSGATQFGTFGAITHGAGAIYKKLQGSMDAGKSPIEAMQQLTPEERDVIRTPQTPPPEPPTTPELSPADKIMQENKVLGKLKADMDAGKSPIEAMQQLTPEERDIIRTQPTVQEPLKGEVNNLPDEQQRVNETLQTEAPPKPIDQPPNEYINDKSLLTTDLSATDLRSAYAADKNTQTLKFNDLADKINALLTDKTDREALTLYRDTKAYGLTPEDIAAGKQHILEQITNHPEYGEAAKRALNPSPDILKADHMLDKLYNETGKTGQQYGFLHNLHDNDDYINRIYKEKLPPQGINTEAYNKRLKTSTSHAKQRSYSTTVDALLDPNAKVEPATLEADKVIKVFGEEYSKTLANNKLKHTLLDLNVGIPDAPNIRTPRGFTSVGHNGYAVPDEMYHGLKSIIEPNYLNKISGYAGVRAVQGIIKTVDVSVSLFHDVTLAFQWMYQNKFNPLATADFAKNLAGWFKNIDSPDFKANRDVFVKHGGMTAQLQDNADILRQLGTKNKLVDKFASMPGIKQAIDLNQKHTEFLFSKTQTWCKVQDFARKYAKYGKDHPGATAEHMLTQGRAIARQVNSAFGGLNWEALGISPTIKALMQTFMFAPDWTYSNVELAKIALKNDAGGANARAHIASGIVGGLIINQAISMAITGHPTWQNKNEGHKFDAEVRPGVYFSACRGGVSDFMNLAQKVMNEGLAGVGQFAGNKMSPGLRGLKAAAANKNYFGQKLSEHGIFGDYSKRNQLNPLQKTGNYVTGVVGETGVIPYSAQNIQKLAKEKNTDPLSYGLAGTGLGTPSGGTGNKRHHRHSRG